MNMFQEIVLHGGWKTTVAHRREIEIGDDGGDEGEKRMSKIQWTSTKRQISTNKARAGRTLVEAMYWKGTLSRRIGIIS